MAKVQLNNISSIDKQELLKISEDISGIADFSSELIYIYSFPTIKKQVIDIKGNPKSSNKSSNSRKISYLKGSTLSTKKWAIRVEGDSNPIDTNFTSKKTAVSHANKLLAKGLGKRIVVLDKV